MPGQEQPLVRASCLSFRGQKENVGWSPSLPSQYPDTEKSQNPLVSKDPGAMEIEKLII